MSGGTGPLAGVKVVELGAFIAGPYAGQLLADLGADVVKVEPPGSGDPMRQWGFAFKDGQSLWWPVIGRNKKSLTLDLRGARGQGLARRLIASADVLVENFRPGTLEKWGLAPETLMAANPGLVIARVSGYGQTGPYADKGGFAAVAEAVGGMRILAGFPDREPVRTGLSIGDTLAGTYATIGILAALYRRSIDGKGQVVDVGLTDAVVAVTESVLSEFSATGRVRVRHGLAAPGIAPSNIYPTADGKHVVIGANADGVFAKLCAAMGRHDLATDPRFAKHQARGVNQAEIDGLVADWTRALPRAEVLARLDAEGVPGGPVNDAADVAADAHFRARESVIERDAPGLGRLVMPGVVPKLDRTPGAVRCTGPAVGEHTEEVLRERLGLGDAEIAELRRDGSV